MKKLLTCTLLSLMLLVAKHSFSSDAVPSSPAQAGTTSTTSPSDKKDTSHSNYRVNPDAAICLIYTGELDLLRLQYLVRIYSTYKVNPNCDINSYTKMTIASVFAQIKTVHNASVITRGGYHYMLMSVNLASVSNPYYEIGNLKFSELAYIRLSVLDILRGKVPSVKAAMTATYTPFIVNTDMYYIWNIGDLIHRLVSPEGKQFIMYSYTNEVAGWLTRNKLVELGSSLNLPPGWKYESILLNKTITVRTKIENNFQAISLVDELNNFYVEYED